MTTTTTQLEERVTVLETEVARLKLRNMSKATQPSEKWWHQIAGTFADDPDFEEAVRLGREYRNKSEHRSLSKE